ncbi:MULTISPECIES: sensor histidine kinase [unclassified Sedimentibacter]|uniref:sensor histidine kinase n=1 Tax=unclassified Sedimentibacter TaxID=2649220 RepID=UPI0027E016A7|nr:ATP-binding protein [Sedimentibacter sp. MB35-C1]WMJ75744.1 ATP-binding protein [Sedimentibacter sp. MB35-C1]
MKNTITRRLTILISLALMISSVLVAFLGAVMSESIKVDNMGKQLIPALSLVEQNTLNYIDGNIDRNTYENIIMNSVEENNRQYIIFNSDGTILINTGEKTDNTTEEKINDSISEILKNKKTVVKLYDYPNNPLVLVGIPIVKENQIICAAFALECAADFLPDRMRFMKAVIISLFIVIPFISVLSYMVLQRIVKPVKNVVEVALSMTEGDFSIRADETLKGEIGFLGRTLNKMSVDLYRNVSQLFIERNRLQKVLDSLEEGMIAVDENKNITHFNKVFLDMFNLKEDIKETCVDDIEIISEDLTELTQVIEGKYSIVKNSTANGRIIRIIIASIEDEKSSAVGAVILFRDITELEKLESMRKNYVANVSHELRSPLTSIRGLIEPLMDSIVTDEKDIKRYYNIIYQESLRLSRLVDDIMELSRLQNDGAVIDKSRVDLKALLEMVYERYRLHDEEISLVYSASPVPKVYTNYDRIEQVMVILLDNAYKFIKKGGTIEISTKIAEKYVAVSVEDTGEGISPDDLPYIFDRFYKSDKSRSKKGTGLGLSIAKEILNIMGESITVESTAGKGSKFEFTVHTEEI